jgi:ankyrin repeat protein
MISMNIPYFWVNLITTSLFSRTPGIMFSKRNHPQMAELFRLVKNYNVPRYLCVISFLHVIQPSPKKATLENTGKNGATPLYVAALNGSREVVNLLLEENLGRGEMEMR